MRRLSGQEMGQRVTGVIRKTQMQFPLHLTLLISLRAMYRICCGHVPVAFRPVLVSTLLCPKMKQEYNKNYGNDTCDSAWGRRNLLGNIHNQYLDRTSRRVQYTFWCNLTVIGAFKWYEKRGRNLVGSRVLCEASVHGWVDFVFLWFIKWW